MNKFVNSGETQNTPKAHPPPPVQSPPPQVQSPPPQVQSTPPVQSTLPVQSPPQDQPTSQGSAPQNPGSPSQFKTGLANFKALLEGNVAQKEKDIKTELSSKLNAVHSRLNANEQKLKKRINNYKVSSKYNEFENIISLLPDMKKAFLDFESYQKRNLQGMKPTNDITKILQEFQELSKTGITDILNSYFQQLSQLQHVNIQLQQKYLTETLESLLVLETTQDSDKFRSFIRQHDSTTDISYHIREAELLARQNSLELRDFQQVKPELTCNPAQIEADFNEKHQQLDTLIHQLTETRERISDKLLRLKKMLQDEDRLDSKLSQIKGHFQNCIRRGAYIDRSNQILQLIQEVDTENQAFIEAKQEIQQVFAEKINSKLSHSITDIENLQIEFNTKLPTFIIGYFQRKDQSLERTIGSIENYLQQPHQSKQRNSDYIRQIEVLHNEILALSQTTQNFLTYLTADDSSSLANQFESKTEKLNDLIRALKLSTMKEVEDMLAKEYQTIQSYENLIRSKISTIDQVIRQDCHPEDPNYFLNQLETEINQANIAPNLEAIERLSIELRVLQTELGIEIQSSVNEADTINNMIAEFHQKKSKYLSLSFLSNSYQFLKLLEDHRIIHVMVKPINNDIVKLQVTNIPICELCSLVQVEFGIPPEQQLIASFDEKPLQSNQLVFDVIESGDKVFEFSFEDSNSSYKPELEIIAPLQPTAPDEYVIFSPLSPKDLSTGALIQLHPTMTPNDAIQAITSFYKGNLIIRDDFQGALFFPGAIPFVQGTLQDFWNHNPNSKRILYYLPFSQTLQPLIQKELPDSINISDPEYVQLLSPLFPSSQNGLELFACFLVFIQQNGPLTSQLIYALSKFFSFPPMITSLFSLSQNCKMTGLMLLQISVPFQALLHFTQRTVDESSNPYTAFESILTFLPFVLYRMSKVSELNWNSASIDDDKILNDSAIQYFAEFPQNKPNFFYLSDLSLTDDIHFRFQFDPALSSAANEYYNEFNQIATLAARKSHTIVFMRSEMSSLLRIDSLNGDENIVDRFVIYNPHSGNYETHTAESIASTATDDRQIISLSDIQELIVIAVDCSGSMGDLFGNGEMKRISAAKLCFKELTSKAFKDFKIDNYYGLAQFGLGNNPSILSHLSPITQNFNSKLDTVDASGYTPLWEAVDLSINHLLQKNRELHANIPMRIICLSDGGATGMRPDTVFPKLIQHKIRFDGIFISNQPVPGDFHAVIKLTGSYLLCPQTSSDIYSLFQDEAFFNIGIREYAPFQSPTVYRDLLSRVSTEPPDQKIRVAFNKEEWLQKPLHSLESAFSMIQSTNTIKNERVQRRLEMELRTFIQMKDPTIRVYVDQANFLEWRIAIQLGKIYENKWFLLIMKFPDKNPPTPSYAFFGAPYHVNVSQRGRIFPEIRYDMNNERFWDIIKKIQKLLNKTYNELVEEHATPVDEEHKITFKILEQYVQKITDSCQQYGKNTPEEFGFNIV